jgi:hypothetical protein
VTPSWHLARRTLLRGAGAALALPFLDAMTPRSVSAAAAKGPLRSVFVFFPNGANMQFWTPTSTGDKYDLPSTLAPLVKFRDQLLILTGLTHDKARAHGDGPGDHARSNSVFLTGAQPLKTDGKDIRVGISVDQVMADKIGNQTRLASLELGCERGTQSGNCDSGYSCAYSSNISWRSSSLPMAKEVNPRQVFERLFGDPGQVLADRDAAKISSYRRSILDSVLSDASDLRRKLGGADQHKVDEYLDAVRTVERQIQAAERKSEKSAVPSIDVPEGIPHETEEYIDLMMDLAVLALQTDSTRIVTLTLANEGSNRNFPSIGVSEGHHNISHHGKNPEKLEKIRKIDVFYSYRFAHLLDKMRAATEAGSTLLDNSMVVYGCAISDGDKHNHDDLPVLLAGKGAGSLKPGRHIRYAPETPMCNLYVAMLERAGVRADKFGDSTGRLGELS